ncbi:MAG TPA: hypothetical protein PLM41_02815 [Saprospiraceae bacterium]|nr:hypothetical protein [Saprospiraceae bacterium]
MENTRLLKLLRTLSKTELQGLKKFVRTPFFNQRSEVPALLDWLLASLKNDRAAFDKTLAYKQVFDSENYDDHRVRMAMSFLYQITGQYLAVQSFLNNGVAYRKQLAAVFRERRLPEQAEKVCNEAIDLQQQISLRNADFMEERYQLLLEKHRLNVEIQRVDQEDLQAQSDQLDHAFLARKLWQACAMLSHRNVSNATYEFGFLDAVLRHAEQSDVLKKPAVAIYYHCYQALVNPAESAHFQQFKQCLVLYPEQFPAEELRDLYILAINYCIRQYNAGNPEYLSQQFDLYKEGLERQYFLSEGIISRYTYQNAATIGLVLRELEWVDSLIHTYKPMLKEEHREGLFSFNLARLEYYRDNPGKALQLLQKAEYKDLLLNLAAKILQLKIFYELQEFDLLASHLQAIRSFIRRKKVMGYHRENYLNTVHFTQKMLEINPFDKTERAELRREIEETKAVAEKEWLLEQI